MACAQPQLSDTCCAQLFPPSSSPPNRRSCGCPGGSSEIFGIGLQNPNPEVPTHLKSGEADSARNLLLAGAQLAPHPLPLDLSSGKALFCLVIDDKVFCFRNRCKAATQEGFPSGATFMSSASHLSGRL